VTTGEFSKIMAEIGHFFKADLKLLTTVFSLQELSRFHASVFKNAVRMVGERLKLNASLAQFSSILEKNNFQVDQKWSASEMRNGNTVLKNSDMAILPGFYLLEASSIN
ncbi:MAG: hypothetical protein R3222_09295, partial [Balneolaceae bacterium]|nr:hypothetical protein [Balneolaceae bacterium]